MIVASPKPIIASPKSEKELRERIEFEKLRSRAASVILDTVFDKPELEPLLCEAASWLLNVPYHCLTDENQPF